MKRQTKAAPKRHTAPPVPNAYERPATPQREPVRAPLTPWRDGEPPEPSDGLFPPL